MTLTDQQARLIRASFDVANGRTYRCPERHIARNVADAANADSGDTVNVYLDSLGFIVTRRPVTRTDATLVYSSPLGFAS